MNKKLIVCDVEGTIFEKTYQIPGTPYNSTVWHLLAEMLHPEAVREERQTQIKMNNGGYANYFDWIEDTYKIHRKYGLTKEIFDTVIGEAPRKRGVWEFFKKKLDRNQYLTACVSGCFLELNRRAQSELGIDFLLAPCEYIFDTKTGLLQSLHPVNAGNSKYEYIEHLLVQQKINHDTDWIYIGDGKHDCDIAEKAPIAFAVDADEELESVQGIYIVKDFFEIAQQLKIWKKEGFPGSIRSWTDLITHTELKLPHICWADCAKDALKKLSFNSVDCNGINRRLSEMNQILDAKTNEQYIELQEKYCHGDRALFSDESEIRKRESKTKLTFKINGIDILCTYHGKINHDAIRIYFSSSPKRGEKVYIAHVGHHL